MTNEVEIDDCVYGEIAIQTVAQQSKPVEQVDIDKGKLIADDILASLRQG